jgi:DNA-binding NarL/FixJ family response regulator
MPTPIRVLIADDSEHLRRAVRTLLAVEQGLTVISEAADYAELLAKIKEVALDVVVMDVHNAWP